MVCALVGVEVCVLWRKCSEAILGRTSISVVSEVLDLES